MKAVPVVLLPGLVCDAAVWAHARAALAERAPVSIAAYGSLDSLPDMAAKVLAEAPPRFAVAGHSMGGRVALEIIRRAPERVAALALLDTGVAPLPAGDAGQREAAGRYELLKIARDQGMAAMAARWVQGMVWKPRLSDTALVNGVIEMFARSSADVFAAQIRALLARPDAGGLLANIHCPTLVLAGEDDSWAPAARHRDMAARIPGATLEVIPQCGHMPTLERPEAVTHALLTWSGGVREGLSGLLGPKRPSNDHSRE
jgi:pimeloyl-ACP methyl ester carboxylesterase